MTALNSRGDNFINSLAFIYLETEAEGDSEAVTGLLNEIAYELFAGETIAIARMKEMKSFIIGDLMESYLSYNKISCCF